MFVQAKNYTRTSGRQIDLIVLHSMEAAEKPGTAENVASWFAGSNAPRASAHRCFDENSNIQCVRDEDVAWHAPGANHNGLGYEMSGYARQTRAEWLDPYGQRMLKIVAAQAAEDAAKYKVPHRFVGPDGLQRGERGFTIHRYVSEAFRRSTHWDTGYHFPEDVFLELVAGITPGSHRPSDGVAQPGGLLQRGSTGPLVVNWQKLLRGAGHDIVVDGVFGKRTEAATKAFQTTLRVAADGVVGPQTRAAVAKLLAWVKATTRNIPSVPPFPGHSRRGDQGPAVRAAQARLRSRGWRIAVDGAFGPETDRVVRAFQAEKGLAVDGVVGPNTWRALWIQPVT